MKEILIVDDDLHIGNMVEEVLTKEGYGVLRAYSGTEAVLLLSQTKPDLVLLDLIYAAMIKNRAEHLSVLTEELFRYSVLLSEGKELLKEPVVLNAALEESVAGFYAVFTERGIVPEIRMPECKVVREADGSALARVFSNTAKMLDEVQVGKLFDRFYTVETARKSTGLGLAIAKSLVERMGGTIGASYEKERLQIRIGLPEKEGNTEK